MEFKEIEFKDANAKRVYINYIKNIKSAIKKLRKIDQQEILMEFNSHIYEGLQRNKAESELDGLLDAIDKIGELDEVLKPLIADKMLEKATKSFNPIDIIRALFLNITNGISYVVFAILYLLIAGFGFTVYKKIIDRDAVGFFYKGGNKFCFGKCGGENCGNELLGDWYIPVVLVLMIKLYIIITLLLRAKRALNKKLK